MPTFSGMNWAMAQELPSLATDDVHVWLLRLDEYVVHFEWFLQTLAPEDLEKLCRFHFQKDREHFAVARVMAKTILGGYLNVAVQEVHFRYNAFGKPALVDPGPKDLRFNLSHSNDLALLAVVCGREVGIDLEYQRAEIANEDIARRFFSASEVESLARLPKDLQFEAFFKYWTCKEAYIKGIGTGLSFPLDKFTVSLNPLGAHKRLEVAGNEEETTRWMFWDVSPNSQYAAAVVAEGSGLSLGAFAALGPPPHGK
ncbi:MAG: 4'-phosphopantetheinyl transferase family protein [Pyrinomonadaceae bacterium]